MTVNGALIPVHSVEEVDRIRRATLFGESMDADPWWHEDGPGEEDEDDAAG